MEALIHRSTDRPTYPPTPFGTSIGSGGRIAEQCREKNVVTEKEVRKALRKVKDPELHLDIVVLGLVYDLDIADTHVNAKISLTSPFCPAAGQIVDDAKAAIEGVEGIETANVELTFDPPWTPERIDPLIRATLGI